MEFLDNITPRDRPEFRYIGTIHSRLMKINKIPYVTKFYEKTIAYANQMGY